jgi:octaprenyl-diphosphate synthase
MVLLAGAACGKITDEHIHIAAIIEMIHNATLLHDDVIDEGQQRRGLRTVNRMWGNEFAVLVGDFLLSRVFHMCADFGPRITGIIAAATVRICEGEMRQIIQRRNWQLSESEYIDIINEKSAALFSSACLLGGLLSQGADAQLQSLSCFGRNVGIAFQITDDLLDITGDESQTGKTIGSDVDKSKLTLAVIHLLSILGGKEKREVIKYLERDAGCDETEPRYNQEDLLEKLRSSGSLEYAHKRAKEFVGRAVEAIALLDESDAKNALMETAEFAANRAF